MNKPIKITDASKEVNLEIEKYDKPEFIYIPVQNYDIKVKEGGYVYKGDVVGVDNKIDMPIHSSISGYVRGIEESTIATGKKAKCLVIENDYKEKYKKEKLVTKKDYTKEEFIDALRTSGIVGLGGASYPTFLKYKTDKKIKRLIINGVECEPLISCDKAIMYNYSESLLEAIDKIMEIMNIPKAIIGVKKSDTTSIEAINKYIGTYPNIVLSLVEDAYPSGWERLLVKKLLNVEYDRYPIEKGIVVNNVSTIYAIYEMLKYNRPLIERVITITGPGIKNKRNVKVKIGTHLSDVINNLDGYKNIKNPLFVVGGPMMGRSVETDNITLTKNINAVMVIEDNFEDNLPCIKCGKCLEVCPAGIRPMFIMNNRDNLEALKCLHPDKCIECGLCSFICPSKIEVREFVRIAKARVNDNEKI